VRIGRKAASAALAFSFLIAINQGANFATAAESPSSEFIVVFKDNVSRTASNKIIADSGGDLIRTFARVFNGSVVFGTFAKMQALPKKPNVLLVEEYLEVTAAAIQNSAPS
jgi:hypothetical protein